MKLIRLYRLYKQAKQDFNYADSDHIDQAIENLTKAWKDYVNAMRKAKARSL